MSATASPLPCAGSAHLDLLVDELDRLVGCLQEVVTAAATERIAARRATEDAASAEASLRLDGGLRATPGGDTVERAGTWLDALGGSAMSDESGTEDATDDGPDDGGVDPVALARMAELERAGVAAGVAADDLADAFGRASADAGGLGNALAVLHGRMTAGLVDEGRAGRLRRGPRVVHDASVGRVLFFPTDPAHLADAWDGLLRHVTGAGAGGAAARRPAAVRAGLLHLELVRHQPFDAANGRVARAAARLALLADGLLPGGLGSPDVVLGEDALGYHEEVGASVRRRDATDWVERALEAHTVALGRTLTALDAPPTGDEVPASLPTDRFTLGDVVEQLGGTADDARRRCSDWVVAGRITRVVGARGLRFRR